MGLTKTLSLAAAAAFVASVAVQLANGRAPLDSFNALLGTPKLHDRSKETQRDRPLDDVEHVACRTEGFGCEPAGGCDRAGLSCEPRIGHYWTLADDDAAPAPSGLAALLPPVPPPVHMMTARGVLVADPGFWVTSYRLRDEPEATLKPFSTLPGVSLGAWVTTYLALPGLVLFFGAITFVR